MLVRLLIGLTASAGIAAACATLPQITDAEVVRAQAHVPNATRESLSRGKSIYVSRCSTCHEPWAPGTRDAATWSEEVDAMAPRARLDDGDRQLVLEYLTAFAAR